ncbi:MAG: hypothetical protein HOB37_09675 [Rhodospirillaceae bacterium]|jgi:hypothetical protein|nr:hypothetical protein [Rhodospirillaceae bacterium]MBT5193386.1 hypothetical protein [Rhodospirillaceae bacterium]MBT5899286.1 hypothetical protein [Rhodospirillaceae bacterium]MBT6426233.1 hypothetical protein [Rhodospirillaceae bacterium]MBT6608718.1 hypothetical protein [Rhodospirillaceae bacterium]
MGEHRGEQVPPMSKKEILKGVLGGLSLLLFVAAIIGGAVLWRASWYFE